jgi:hypothetical protein
VLGVEFCHTREILAVMPAGEDARMSKVNLGVQPSSAMPLTIAIPSGVLGIEKSASAPASLAARIMLEKSVVPGAYSP